MAKNFQGFIIQVCKYFVMVSGTLYEDCNYLEKQTAIYVFLCISLMKRQVKKESFSKGCKFHLPVRSTTWFLRLLLCAGVFRKAGSDIILWLGCWLQSWKGQVTHLPLAKLDLS